MKKLNRNDMSELMQKKVRLNLCFTFNCVNSLDGDEHHFCARCRNEMEESQQNVENLPVTAKIYKFAEMKPKGRGA